MRLRDKMKEKRYTGRFVANKFGVSEEFVSAFIKNYGKVSRMVKFFEGVLK